MTKLVEIIERCPSCGRNIVVQRETLVDMSANDKPAMMRGVYSEYRGEGGVCYDCDEKKRKKSGLARGRRERG